MIEIKQAFENKINSITPTIQTAYENVTFTPTAGVPYQELYLIPATNDNIFIDGEGFISYGIFQITLKYPTGKGTKDISDRVKLYLDNFKSGDNLVQGGITTNILNTPKVVSLGTSGDRIIYAISINYQAFY